MGNEKGLLLLKMVCPNHDEISEPYRFQRVSHKLATVAAKRLLFELSSLSQYLGEAFESWATSTVTHFNRAKEICIIERTLFSRNILAFYGFSNH